MAAGTKVGGVSFGNALVGALLDKGDSVNEAGARRACFTLAVACLETGHQLAEDLRARVLSHLPEIMPPTNSEEARVIAAAGDAALPLLELKHWRDEKAVVVAACAQAVAAIGSPKAVMMLMERGGYGNDRRASVIAKVCECPGIDPTAIPRIQTWIGGYPTEEMPMVVRPFFTNIAPLIKDERVIMLDLQGFSGVTDLSALRRLRQLTSLDLSGMTTLADIEPVGGLVDLRRLDLAQCIGVSDISPIAGLRNLRELDLSGLVQISDVSALLRLKALVQLSLVGIGDVDVSGFDRMRSLEVLDIRGCRNIKGLETLASHRSLNEVIVDTSVARHVRSIVGRDKVSAFTMRAVEAGYRA